MTRWLIVGAGGLLGQDLMAVLKRDGEAAVGLARRHLDITDQNAVVAAVRRYKPDVTVNCAAWTAVDKAEAHEEEALRVNGAGAAHLAVACVGEGSRLIQISTDYVFGGDTQRPYSEGDVPNPRTAYGRTKLVGEQAILGLLPEAGYLVRTAWLYGAHRPNFVYTMMRLEQERPTVDVVDDQHGQPTWTADVADQLTALVRSNAPAGIYHATSTGDTTWFGLAREVFRLLGADSARVRATTSTAFQRKAVRPAYSVLGHEAWSPVRIDPIGDWRQALRTAFPALAAAWRLKPEPREPSQHTGSAGSPD